MLTVKIQSHVHCSREDLKVLQVTYNTTKNKSDGDQTTCYHRLAEENASISL